MNKIKPYSEMLESSKNSKRIFEQAMAPEKVSKLKRLKDAGDVKGVLKELKNDIQDIQKKLEELECDDIEYSYKDGIITILYTNNMMTLLSILKGKIREYSSEEIDQKIFGGGWKELFLEIELDQDMLNRIDIINGLPNFIKGIGLGRKIYKKIIKDFGFISSFDGYEPSLDSSMVWESIAKDKEIFTFTNNENIISFWYDINYEIIIEKLKEFYVNKGDIQFDDDFLIKYNLTDLKLVKLL